MRIIRVSKHAKTRIKQRCGIPKKSADKLAKKAYKEGIRHCETKGRLNKWLNKVYLSNRNANNIRLYGDKAYIFCGDTLVTVLQIPSDLMKDFHNMVKRRPA